MLKHIDGFDQFQLHTGGALLAALTAAGYIVSTGLAMAAGRHDGTFALEMQVSAGASGSSWSMRTNSIRQDLNGVATNDTGRWIAVGNAGSAVSSTDTITWTPLVTGVSTQLNAIGHNAGRWITVGNAGTILVSTDNGQTWTPRTSPLPAANLNDIKFAAGAWVIAGTNGTAGAILTSTDNGETWSFVTDNAGTVGNTCVEYGGGRWMIGGLNGQLRTSTDALVWTSLTFGVNVTIPDIAYGAGTWLIGHGRNVRYSLNDGTTWQNAATDLGTNTTVIQTVAYSGGRWIAAGAVNFMATSDDMLTWTVRTLTGGVGGGQMNEVAVSQGADASLLVVGKRNGTQTTAVAAIFASSAPPTTVQRTFTSASNRVVIGFAHRATARGRILSIAGLFDMEWPGAVQILGSSSTAIPIRNAWYYYELVIDKTAQTVQLFVNDTADMVVPLPAGVATMTDFVITWQAENGAIARLDDLYLLDSEATGGATLVNRLRPIRIPLRLPNADMNVEWEASAEVPHWSLVGVLPPDEENYIRSAESGKEDLFTSSTPLPAGSGAVLAVGVLAFAKKSDLDNRQLGLVVGDGVNQLEVVDTVLNTTAEYSQGIFETAPGGSPWDATNILSVPFGVVVRP